MGLYKMDPHGMLFGEENLDGLDKNWQIITIIIIII